MAHEVTLPSGEIVSFPDETSDDEVSKALSNYPGAQATTPGNPPPSAFQSGGAPLPGSSTPAPSGPVAAAQGYFGTLNAAFQGTSPVVRDIKGNLNYNRLGDSMTTDAGPGYIDSSGKWQLVDPTRHVMLTDPATGRMTVFERNQEMEEGRATVAGRLASFAVPSGPPSVPVTAGGPSIAAGILSSPITKTAANIGVGGLSGLIGEHFGLSPEVVLGALLGGGHSGVGSAIVNRLANIFAARVPPIGTPVMNPGTAAIPGLLNTVTGGMAPQPPY